MKNYDLYHSDSSDFQEIFTVLEFPGQCGFLASREKSDDHYEVYIASVNPHSWEIFKNGAKREEEFINLDDLISGLLHLREEMDKKKRIK